jgi:hydroxymethylpyrimidine/phosphomethylpyrimidine kinase
MTDNPPPIVLVFAGTDPTGGAGLAADILTLDSLGCHPAPVTTAVTAQDTAGLKQFTVVEAELVIAQARAVLEDMPVAAIKTGMFGHSAMVAAVDGILGDYPDIPVVIDPVQATDGGQALVEESLVDALRTLLIPRATLMTPNSEEAKLLAPDADTLDACAQELMSLGSQYVLITGVHENKPRINNRLYGNMRLLETFTCERLPQNYHGSGCTLASACAAGLAHRLDPIHATSQALRYTWQSLKQGFRPGMGQYLPDRLYWLRDTDARPKTDAD